jgi:hypothetical protein
MGENGFAADAIGRNAAGNLRSKFTVSLTGYGGHLRRKRWLLTHERRFGLSNEATFHGQARPHHLVGPDIRATACSG